MPDITKVNEILKKHNKDVGQLIGILQDIQAEYNYLPRHPLEHVARELNIPESQVYGVATFFKAFSLKPRGKHIIHVCMGTACHVRGAKRILEECERDLSVAAGETTKDGKFTLETVNCLGACALGPIVVMDGHYHGHFTSADVKKVLPRCGEKH